MDESPSRAGRHRNGPTTDVILQSLPLRILAVSDFGATAAPPRPVAVSADDFRAVLEAFKVRIPLAVPNLLASRPETLHLDIPMAAFDDITPKGLAEHLAPLCQVHRLRHTLQAYQTGAAQPHELRAAMLACRGLDALAEAVALCEAALAGGPGRPGPPPPPAKPGQAPPDDPLAKVLGMVDMEDTSSGNGDRGGGALERVMGHLAGNGRRSRRLPELDRALKIIERTLAAQINVVLHQPALQRIESAWRGLHFLIARSDRRAGVHLEILHAPWDDLHARFVEDVAEPLAGDGETVSPGLVLFDYPLRRAPGEVETLQALAQTAARLHTPLVWAVQATFFGLDADHGLAGVAPATLLEQPQYIKWNALRGQDVSRWLAVACNRFLLRGLYRGEDRRSAGLREAAGDDSDYLWGSPVWAVGALAAASFADSGWPCNISGGAASQVENLALRPVPGQATASAPLAALAGADRVQDFGEVGLMCLAARANDDNAYLIRAPMLYARPNAVGAPGRAELGLPHQLCAARLAELLARNHGALTAAADGDAAEDTLKAVLLALLRDTGPGADAAVRLHGGPPGDRRLQVVLSTGRKVLGGRAFEFEMLL